MLILKSPAFCLPPFQAANFFSLLSHWVSLTCHPYLECLPVRDPCSLCPSPPTYPTPSSLLSRFLSSLLHPLLPPSQILLSILVWRPGKPFQHPRCHCPCCWSQAHGCTVPSCFQGKHFIAVSLCMEVCSLCLHSTGYEKSVSASEYARPLRTTFHVQSHPGLSICLL